MNINDPAIFGIAGKTTVMRLIKEKSDRLVQVNPNFQTFEEGQSREVTLKPFCEETELDE